MPKRLLVYSTCGMSLPHISLELEILKSHFNNYEKTLMFCNGNLTSCYFNRVHNVLGCTLCTERTKSLLQKNLHFEKIVTISDKRKLEIEKIFSWEINEIINLSYKGIDFGRGIISSLISIHRDHKLDLSKYKNYIISQANQCMSLIDQIDELNSTNPLDTVLIFNGRFSEVYPIKAYCELNNIVFYTHEKGSDFNRYQLIKNNTVHSLSYRKTQMDELWENYPGDPAIIATKWFEDKRKGTIKTEKNFTENQSSGQLPEEFNRIKHNVVIFNSSEDEFKSIKEWSHNLFSDQNEIIIKIAEALVNEPINIYLRFHPNLRFLADQQILELKRKNLGNLIIIPPESNVSSYALMSVCDKILTFGSRTSIEAAYINKPSIIYGKSFYHELISLYTPNNFENLIELVKNIDLKPKEETDYLKAALFLKERGKLTVHVDVKDKNTVLLNGIRYKSKIYILIFTFVKQLRHTYKWVFNVNNLRLRKFNLKDFKRL